MRRRGTYLNGRFGQHHALWPKSSMLAKPPPPAAGGAQSRLLAGPVVLVDRGEAFLAPPMAPRGPRAASFKRRHNATTPKRQNAIYALYKPLPALFSHFLLSFSGSPPPPVKVRGPLPAMCLPSHVCSTCLRSPCPALQQQQAAYDASLAPSATPCSRTDQTCVPRPLCCRCTGAARF